jgi:rubrerythrin
MGYYSSGKEEFEEELRWLRIEREGYYICKKCRKKHSKNKCPNCNSTSKEHNYG